MFHSSFHLGTIAGIRVGVHYTWFLIFALLSSSLYTIFVEQHPLWTGQLALTTAVITSLLFFVSIILHEFGHSFVAMAYGIPVRSITLFIFGGVAQTEKEAETPAAEFWIAIAGPLVSFMLAAVFHVLNKALGPLNDAGAESLSWLASINLIVAIFNLIPGFPLDGGRVFRAAAWRITGDVSKGMSWAVMSGRVVAIGLMSLGIVTVIQPGLLLNGIWFLGIGWFLLAAAEASGQAFMVDRVLREIPVADVMQQNVPFVDSDLSVADWIDSHVLPLGQRCSLVRKDQRVIGLITMSDSRKISRDRWSDTRVREIMTPLERLHTVTPETDLAAIVRNMGFYSINQVPVVDQKGVVVGWIGREGILKTLHARSNTRS